MACKGTPERVQLLLVNDNPSQRTTVRKLLEPIPIEVIEAGSGYEALELLEPGEFTIVLLDTEMPGLNGFETARRIRELSHLKSLPIVFVTTADDAARYPATEAYTLGIVDYLIEPLDPVVLRGKVQALANLVTERRRAVRQAEQLNLLIEGTTDYAIFMLDPQGYVVSWNPGAERIKGYSASDIIGRHFSTFYTADALEREWPAYELKMARQTGRFEDEGWRVRKDGSRFWASVIITTLWNEQDEVIGFSKITRDLTERKKAEETLRHAKEELEVRVTTRTAELARANEALREADRRKDDFLAMLAHELRNPLAPVRNALQIMKMPGLDSNSFRNARDMVERQVDHMVRLVDDLLDMSRMMRGKIELRREIVDLATLFARGVETAQPIINSHGHVLRVDIPQQPVKLYGDLVRLAQVVSNLLTNAAKYTEKAGRIWLTGEIAEDHVVIRVRDTGIGIDPPVLPRIFDLFMQIDRSLARSQGGLGIGLTLVKRLVELHEGTVTAHSEGLGRGSEFEVRLPALKQFATAHVEPKDDLKLRASAPRRVLVVDDNVDAAESAAMLLRFLGHDVELAYDGNSALDKVRCFRPEIVLLDIGLPGMSGYDVARALRALPEYRGLVIVAVTGYGQEEDRRRSKEAGIDYHMTKPLAPNVLTALVDSPGTVRKQ
jgi:PAS domain S-box-containing protein